MPGYTSTMTDAEFQSLAKRFPYIVKWEEMMGAFPYFIEAQLRRAAKENAPENAIYYSENVPNTNGRHWQTLDDVENPNVFVRFGLEVPERLKYGARFNISHFFVNDTAREEFRSALQTFCDSWGVEVRALKD